MFADRNENLWFKRLLSEKKPMAFKREGEGLFHLSV